MVARIEMTFGIEWIFISFMLGGICGMTAMALMFMAREPRIDVPTIHPKSVSPWLDRPSGV